MELLSTTYTYSKQKRREINTEEQSLQNLQELDSKICNCDVLDKAVLDKYETAKEELKKFTNPGEKRLYV